MDRLTKESVHPSFSEVIKQMDSLDVRIFTKIYRKNVLPIYKLEQKKNGEPLPILSYLLSDDFYENVSETKQLEMLFQIEMDIKINIQILLK